MKNIAPEACVKEGDGERIHAAGVHSDAKFMANLCHCAWAEAGGGKSKMGCVTRAWPSGLHEGARQPVWLQQQQH